METHAVAQAFVRPPSALAQVSRPNDHRKMLSHFFNATAMLLPLKSFLLKGLRQHMIASRIRLIAVIVIR
jgi:hypothetical protein